MATFTVDTHLFRELGELLVGRDSTALVELIKNSYDADATNVIVNALALDDPDHGVIEVIDDGTGMTLSEFEQGFLRIASRAKTTATRRSSIFRRRFTGAKGIGRLAAHKLARVLDVTSVPRSTGDHKRRGVKARIDWDEIERYETLLDLADSDAISTEELRTKAGLTPGTSVILQRLRRRWREAERGRFVAEVQAFQPPGTLVKPLPKSIVPRPLLFREPSLRDITGKDLGFNVELQGDFEAGETFWPSLAEAANWVIEIDADTEYVRYAIAPTSQTTRAQPDAESGSFEVEQPSGDGPVPIFQARILIREGSLKPGQAYRSWAQQTAGIRVYLEGFRVLPYGEPRNDWLSIDSDYSRRSRTLPWMVEEFRGDPVEQEGLSVLPNVHYYGGVFLTEALNPHFQMLVNREGFVPGSEFDLLVRHVRTGVDLSTRLRAAASAERREARMSSRRMGAEGSETRTSQLADAIDEGVRHAKAAREALAEKSYGRVAPRLNKALAAIEQARAVSTRLVTEEGMLRVLASVGAQMSAFTHEINALLGTAQSVERAISKLREDENLSRTQRNRLARVLLHSSELRRALERQASYLVDVVSVDARRRRRRMKLRDRFDAATRLIARSAERRNVQVINAIPEDLISPPMFPAELTTVFSNLLTNALKATRRGGRIRARARNTHGNTLVIENTGVRVNLRTAERWFRPFESTTTKIDVTLGQGMGLGLPITRSILEEYGAEIQFTRPTKGYSTAIELVFP